MEYSRVSPPQQQQEQQQEQQQLLSRSGGSWRRTQLHSSGAPVPVTAAIAGSAPNAPPPPSPPQPPYTPAAPADPGASRGQIVYYVAGPPPPPPPAQPQPQPQPALSPGSVAYYTSHVPPYSTTPPTGATTVVYHYVQPQTPPQPQEMGSGASTPYSYTVVYTSAPPPPQAAQPGAVYHFPPAQQPPYPVVPVPYVEGDRAGAVQHYPTPPQQYVLHTQSSEGFSPSSFLQSPPSIAFPSARGSMTYAKGLSDFGSTSAPMPTSSSSGITSRCNNSMSINFADPGATPMTVPPGAPPQQPPPQQQQRLSGATATTGCAQIQNVNNAFAPFPMLAPQGSNPCNMSFQSTSSSPAASPAQQQLLYLHTAASGTGAPFPLRHNSISTSIGNISAAAPAKTLPVGLSLSETPGKARRNSLSSPGSGFHAMTQSLASNTVSNSAGADDNSSESSSDMGELLGLNKAGSDDEEEENSTGSHFTNPLRGQPQNMSLPTLLRKAAGVAALRDQHRQQQQSRVEALRVGGRKTSDPLTDPQSSSRDGDGEEEDLRGSQGGCVRRSSLVSAGSSASVPASASASLLLNGNLISNPTLYYTEGEWYEGRVKRFNPVRGFGFLMATDLITTVAQRRRHLRQRQEQQKEKGLAVTISEGEISACDALGDDAVVAVPVTGLGDIFVHCVHVVAPSAQQQQQQQQPQYYSIVPGYSGMMQAVPAPPPRPSLPPQSAQQQPQQPQSQYLTQGTPLTCGTRVRFRVDLFDMALIKGAPVNEFSAGECEGPVISAKSQERFSNKEINKKFQAIAVEPLPSNRVFA